MLNEKNAFLSDHNKKLKDLQQERLERLNNEIPSKYRLDIPQEEQADSYKHERLSLYHGEEYIGDITADNLKFTRDDLKRKINSLINNEYH